MCSLSSSDHDIKYNLVVRNTFFELINPNPPVLRRTRSESALCCNSPTIKYIPKKRKIKVYSLNDNTNLLTTVMLKNIPCGYTQDMFRKLINLKFDGSHGITKLMVGNQEVATVVQKLINYY